MIQPSFLKTTTLMSPLSYIPSCAHFPVSKNLHTSAAQLLFEIGCGVFTRS